MKPEGITGEQVRKGVLSYARSYLRKSLLDDPWIRGRLKRRHMLGCLKAFATTTVTKQLYDLGRVKCKGLSTEIDLGVDQSKALTPDQIGELKRNGPDLAADVKFKGAPIKVLACGGPSDAQLEEQKIPVPVGRSITRAVKDAAAG